jgi:hypothetical protein
MRASMRCERPNVMANPAYSSRATRSAFHPSWSLYVTDLLNAKYAIHMPNAAKATTTAQHSYRGSGPPPASVAGCEISAVRDRYHLSKWTVSLSGFLAG